MDLSKVKPAEGATKKRKRIGRGEGSGHGGTATRGHKGYHSRSGSKSRPWFEGGQMPLNRRVPKRGFKNHNRVEYTVFNLARLEEIAEKFKLKEISVENLVANKLAHKNAKVKILANGELKSKLTVTAHAASEKAKAAIEAAGGTINLL